MKQFQEDCKQWLVACMGEKVANDKAERNHRLLEETLELVQSAGCTKEECLQLIDYVYSRKKGDISQEVGGSMVCLASLCNAHGLNMESIARKTVQDNWLNIDNIRQKRLTKPEFSPLP